MLERYEFLKGQHDDLMEAEKTLVQIIEELDIAMRNNLKNSLQRSQGVRQCIQTAFWRRKGNARIVRRRRHSRSGYSHYCTSRQGKKLQNMMAAFVDGEKALTAICTFVCYPKFKAIPILSS